jgi:HlyD family secretion protein
MAHARRNLILALVGVAIAGGLAYVIVRPEPVLVDLHTIEREPFAITIDVDGQTWVKEVFDIAAPIAGVARRSPVDVGDWVIAGETLVATVEPVAPALLDTRTRVQTEAAIREAEAALQVAETELARASEEKAFVQGEFDRATLLVERGVASLTRLEDATRALAVADAGVVAAQARIAQARSGLERAQAGLIDAASERGSLNGCCVPLYAPVDGRVLNVQIVSERPVAAGERLVSVGNPDNLEIVADILSSDAVRLQPNARASVERWGGEPFEARLVQIDPVARTRVSALGIEEQRVDAVLAITAPPEATEGLGHGFSVFLRIVAYENPDALAVPLSAAFRSGEDWSVFRANGDRVERVVVELGARNTRFAEVLSGLEAGDRVVMHPNDALDDGSFVAERTLSQ